MLKRGHFTLKSHRDAPFASPTLSQNSIWEPYDSGLRTNPIRNTNSTRRRRQHLWSLWLVMSTAVKRTLHTRGLLAEFGFKQNISIPILCDNGAAWAISRMENYSKRTRRIAVRMVHLTETSRRGETTVMFTSGEKEKADNMVTKALSCSYVVLNGFYWRQYPERPGELTKCFFKRSKVCEHIGLIPWIAHRERYWDVLRIVSKPSVDRFFRTFSGGLGGMISYTRNLEAWRSWRNGESDWGS